MSNKYDYIDDGFMLFVFFIMIVLTISAYGIGMTASDNWVRKEAVKNGVAEWVADENGNAEFRWKK